MTMEDGNKWTLKDRKANTKCAKTEVERYLLKDIKGGVQREEA